MTDTNAPEATPAETGDVQPGIRILAQFVRDFSFENPLAPDALRAGSAQPAIDMGVEMNARGRADGLFEVDLKLSARAEREGQAVFHVEVVYGGLFHIAGIPEDRATKAVSEAQSSRKRQRDEDGASAADGA